MTKVTYLEAILQAQHEEMTRDGKVFIMGEDIVCNVFGTTTGFVEAFGTDRVRDTPISENGFVGAGAGAAMVGMRPIVDVTLSPFLYPAMDQIVSIVAKSRYIYGGQARLPMVIRSCLFYSNANAAQHSDRPYSMFMNVPGLKIMVPLTAYDMKGMLKAAIRDDDPVLCFEDGTCWTSKDEVPDDPDFLIPLGRGDIKREGTDVSVVAVAGAVPLALKAAKKLAKEGISIGMVQRLDNQAGKIIHLDRDGHAVAGGPFARVAGARPELWAVGFRNSAGLTRTEDGRVWTIDIGPNGGDELNLVKPGGNYGWPLVTWGFDYTGHAMSDRQEAPEFVDPIATWSPSRAPGDLTEYTGDQFPQWRGDLFASELMGQVVRRLRIRDGKLVLEEALLGDLRERIRSVATGPDGYLYLITDSARGRLFRIRPGKPAAADAAHVAKPYPRVDTGNMQKDFAQRGVYQERFTQVLFNFKYDEAKAKTLFAQNCASCHSAGSFTSGEIGPNLNGVAGRRSGSLPGYAYSVALRDPKTAVQWDNDSLVSFISNPQAYYPGTRMAIAPIDDLETVRQIAAYLEHTDASAPHRKSAP